MSLDLGPAIRTAILAQSDIVALLGEYEGAASVHTRRPVPEAAEYPMVVAADDITIGNEDFVNSLHPVVTRQIGVYGRAVEDYRAVESIGYLLRDLFHKDRFSLTVSGYKVTDISVQGPVIAPASSDDYCGRMVTLTVRLQPTS